MTTKQTKRISGKTTSKTQSATPALKVALLGFGTVGSSVAKVLATQKFPGIELTHIYNRNVERKRTSEAAKFVPKSTIWTEDVNVVLNSNVDVVVELMGGLIPAEGWLRKAILSGKSVVTANKQLIAYKGAALAKLAAANGVQLVYGAAVAGGVPVIPGLAQGLGGDQITRISGIVNGTCNYILTRMETGADYATVLADAQALGYAESDPSADVDGYDARAKLCILSRIAMHAELNPDDVATQSIADVDAIDFAYAKELNCTIRQVSSARIAGSVIQARVAPMLVPLASPMAWSHGTQNMVVASGRFGGDVVFSGHGAGGEPTAVAVVSDLLAVAQGSHAVQLPVKQAPSVTASSWPRTMSAWWWTTSRASSRRSLEHWRRWARTLTPSCNGRVIQSIRLPFVVTTEPCLTSTIHKALASIAKMDCMLEPPLCLQMVDIEDKG